MPQSPETFRPKANLTDTFLGCLPRQVADTAHRGASDRGAVLFSFGDESVSVVIVLGLDGYRFEAFFPEVSGFQNHWSVSRNFWAHHLSLSSSG